MSKQLDYLNNTFTYTLNTAHWMPDVWQVTPYIQLFNTGHSYMLTDYTPEITMGDTNYYTVITGSLGQCLKYIHKNIRSLS